MADEKVRKVGMVVTGQIWAINEYVNKETKAVYHSIDLAVKGIKQMLNVKIPSEFNRAVLREDETITLPITFAIKNFNGKITPEFSALV